MAEICLYYRVMIPDDLPLSDNVDALKSMLRAMAKRAERAEALKREATFTLGR